MGAQEPKEGAFLGNLHFMISPKPTTGGVAGSTSYLDLESKNGAQEPKEVGWKFPGISENVRFQETQECIFILGKITVV